MAKSGTDNAATSSAAEKSGSAPETPPVPDPAPAKPRTSQAEPTKPRPIDPKTGFELDEHGLPTSGPARAQWLAKAGIADPALTERKK